MTQQQNALTSGKITTKTDIRCRQLQASTDKLLMSIQLRAAEEKKLRLNKKRLEYLQELAREVVLEQIAREVVSDSKEKRSKALHKIRTSRRRQRKSRQRTRPTFSSRPPADLSNRRLRRQRRRELRGLLPKTSTSITNT